MMVGHYHRENNPLTMLERIKKKKKENPSPFTGLSRKSKLCCIILSFFQQKTEHVYD